MVVDPAELLEVIPGATAELGGGLLHERGVHGVVGHGREVAFSRLGRERGTVFIPGRFGHDPSQVGERDADHETQVDPRACLESIQMVVEQPLAVHIGEGFLQVRFRVVEVVELLAF